MELASFIHQGVPFGQLLVVNEQNRGITYLKQLSVAISYLVGIFVDTDFPEKI